MPLTECLKDTVARVLPFWDESMAPAIKSGRQALVARYSGDSSRSPASSEAVAVRVTDSHKPKLKLLPARSAPAGLAIAWRATDAGGIRAIPRPGRRYRNFAPGTTSSRWWRTTSSTTDHASSTWRRAPRSR